MHQVSVTGSTNELLEKITLPENTGIEIDNETVVFTSQSEGEIKKIKEKIGDILSVIIEQKYAGQLVERYLENSEIRLSYSEKEQLLQDIFNKKIFDGTEFIREKLSSFLSLNDKISVEGFAEFRLWEYKNIIREFTESFVKKSVAEKEYREQIEILRIYVDSMPCLERKLNLYISPSGGYTVFSEKWKDITEECICKPGEYGIGEMSFDELLLSSVISAAPEELEIHNENNCKNPELIKLLEKIFEGRVRRCGGCSFCRNEI